MVTGCTERHACGKKYCVSCFMEKGLERVAGESSRRTMARGTGRLRGAGADRAVCGTPNGPVGRTFLGPYYVPEPSGNEKGLPLRRPSGVEDGIRTFVSLPLCINMLWRYFRYQVTDTQCLCNPPLLLYANTKIVHIS